MLEVKPGENFDVSEVIPCTRCEALIWEESIPYELEYDADKFICAKCLKKRRKKS